MIDLSAIKARAALRLAVAPAASIATAANPAIWLTVADAPTPISQLATLASNDDGPQSAAHLKQPNPDRWCWPNSDAMNKAELATMAARLRKFERRGIDQAQAEQLADRLVELDRDASGLRVCAECSRLSGIVGRPWRCSAQRAAGVAAELAADLVTTPQRCPAFRGSSL